MASVDRAEASRAIRMASNAWRWRQVALERLAAGDEIGAERAIDLAILAETAATDLTDSFFDNLDQQGRSK